MGEVNQRLRVMLGIDASKPAGDLANGRGGEDGLCRTAKPVSGEPVPWARRGSRQQVSGWGRESALDFSESIEEVTQQVRESLQALTKEAANQEKPCKT